MYSPIVFPFSSLSLSAVKSAQVYSGSRVFLCMYASPTQMWHPAHTTTFVLPVFEIEQIIVQLSSSLGINGATIDAQINKQIRNWQTVLSNYRQHNDDLTPMFSVENVLFVNMTKSFRLWEQGIISDADLVGIVDSEKQLDDDALTSSSRSVNDPRNVAKFYRDLSQSFHTVSDSCSRVPELLHASGLRRLRRLFVDWIRCLLCCRCRCRCCGPPRRIRCGALRWCSSCAPTASQW